MKAELEDRRHGWLDRLSEAWRRRRPRIGVVLSGGAARGIAHVGVLQTLTEMGVPIDLVVGVSAGAAVGAMFCAGLSPADLERIARELRWGRISRVRRPGLGLFDLSPMEGFMEELLGRPVRFEELRIPFAAVAVDIVTGELIVLNRGRLAPAVHASCAVPAVFTPVHIDGRMLVDGGTINNLPVSVARDLGADYVIAVDLGRRGVLPREPRHMLDILIATFYIRTLAAHAEAGQADCLITPDVRDFGLADLGSVDGLLEAGRAATREVMPKLARELKLLPPA